MTPQRPNIENCYQQNADNQSIEKVCIDCIVCISFVQAFKDCTYTRESKIKTGVHNRQNPVEKSENR